MRATPRKVIVIVIWTVLTYATFAMSSFDMGHPLAHAQSARDASSTGLTQDPDGLGPGIHTNLEVGINIAAFERIKADIADHVYDRACTAEEHDPTVWHSLVNTRAQCHYDHHHGDDPSYVSDIFGAPGAWFGKSGQSISYPWQTFVMPPGVDESYVQDDPSQFENAYKHEGYGWVVRRNQDCPTRRPDTAGSPFVRSMGACVTDLRIQYHFHGTMDAPVRYHSTSAELRLCLDKQDAATCGIYRTGGWMDMGRLFTTQAGNLSCDHGSRGTFVPLPDETRFGPFERIDSRDELRCHPMVADLSRLPRQDATMAEWWGHIPAENGLRYQLRVHDMMGNIDPRSPNSVPGYFCSESEPSCKFTSSTVSIILGYTQSLRTGFGPGTHTIYLNRWGDRVSDCAESGVDCVPQVLENVQANLDYNGDGRAEEARYFHTPCWDCTRTDYNIAPAGEQWVTWFYRYHAGRH